MTSLAQPAVAEASTEAEQVDAPRQTAPDPEPERELDELHLAPPSAVSLEVPDSAAPAAQELVRILAPLLGLDPGRVVVDPGPPSARPGVVSVGEAPSRALVAHELSHLGQHANRRRPSAVPDTTAAEAEAAAIAVAARTGAPLWEPRAALPAGRVALLTDASGLAPTKPPPNAGEIAAELDQLVKSTRIAELKQIKDANSSAFTTTSGAVEVLVQVLETMDFVTARAVVHALEPAGRIRLAHLNDDHHHRYPAGAVAVLAGLAPAEWAALAAEPRSALRDALHGLDTSHLSDTQLRTVVGALRNVPQSVLVELERSDRREAFRALLGTPPPAGSDYDELLVARDRERRAQSAAADDLAKGVLADLTPILTSASEEKVKAALDKLEPLTEAAAEETSSPPAPPPPAREAPSATESAPRAKPATNAPPTAPESLRAIVAALDTTSMVEYLLDGLPESERYIGDRSRTLQRVLEARAPARSLPRIESLLSYGIFDWAITDSDARFAYFLVHSLPLAEQDAWRVRDGSKWFRRLEDNIPEDMVASGEYTGVGSEYLPGDPAAPAADQEEVKKRYEEYVGTWRESKHGPTARSIARNLIARDPRTGGRLEPDPNNLNTRTQVVRRLDTVGIVDELFDKFPDEYVLSAATRHELLELAVMRDPLHVLNQATSLMETGLLHFDFWVSSREAWVAVQLMRSLPFEAREVFRLADLGRWQHMLDAMTDEMRALWASDPNFGRGALPDREALRKRLQDPKLWELGHAPELRSLVDLLLADDDGAFVFEQSKVRNAHLSKDPAIKQMVADFGLYNPNTSPPRVEFKPPTPETRSGVVELLRFVDESLPFTVEWALLLFRDIFILDRISIGQQSVLAHGFKLGSAQWAAHGDLAGGAHFTDPPHPRTPTPSGKMDQPGVEANTISWAALDPAGPVRLHIPEVQLDRLSIGHPGAAIRTGRMTIRGLDVKASFSDRHYRKPIGAKIHADTADVDDTVIADTSLPGTPWALAHLFVQPLDLVAGAKGTEDMEKEVPRMGVGIPIPIFGPMWEALTNIVAIKGGIPADYTVIDWALLGPTWNLNFFASEAISIPLNKAIKTPAPLDYVWGLFSDGTLRPPRSIAERAKDAMAMMQSLSVSFKELKIDGLSIGSGQQVHGLTLSDVNLGVASSRPAYLRLLIDSLKRVLPKMNPGAPSDAVQQRIDDAQKELDGDPQKGKPGLTQLEDELQKLEAKDRWIAGSLTETERRRLAQLSDLLRRDTGAIIDIGGIEVGPLTGKIVAAGAKVGPIHLDGRVPLKTGAYLADETLAERFRAGAPKAPTTEGLAKESDLHLTIASASVVQGPGTEPAIQILADRIPTERDLQKRLTAMPPSADPVLRTRVEKALKAVEAIEDLRKLDPNGTNPAIQDKISSQSDVARAELGFEAHAVTLGPIEGKLEPDGSLAATVHGVDVQDIRGDGWALQRFTGDVTLGVKDLARLGDYRRVTGKEALNALTGHFRLDRTTATGFRTEAGVTVGTVGITGLHGDVKKLPDGYALSNLWATRIAAGDVNVGVAAGHITARGATIEGLGLNAELHLDADGGLKSGTISRLDINRLLADTVVYDAAKTSDGGTLHVQLTSGALGDIRARGLVYDLDSDGAGRVRGGLTVGGIEQLQYIAVMSALDSGSKKLKTTTIKGAAEGGKMLPPAEDPGTVLGPLPETGVPPVIDAQFAFGKGGYSVGLGLKDLDLLGTEVTTPDGSLVIQHLRAGGSLGITEAGVITSLDLTDVLVSHARWKAGKAEITSDGSLTLKTVHVRAKLMNPKPESKDPNEQRGGFWIDDFDVVELNANNLRYHDPPIDIKLGRADDPHPGTLHAKEIRLQGFFMPYKPGTKELDKAVSGHLGVTAPKVDFRGTVSETLSVSGGLAAESITLDIFEHDKLVLRGVGIGGDVSIDKGDEAHVHAVLTKLDTGVVTITPDAIVIGGPGQPGLQFKLLHLDELSIDSLASDPAFQLILKDKGAVDLVDVEASARIERWKPGEKHEDDEPFKRAVVDRLVIGRIEAEGLSVWFPGLKILIRVPGKDEYKGTDELPPRAFLRKVELAGADGVGKSFEWVPGKKGHVSGKVSADEISVPALEANVANRFHGTVGLHTDHAAVELLQNGDTVIDFLHPAAKLKDPAWLDNPNRKLVIQELGAENATIALKKGAQPAATVTGAYLKKLRYEQPGLVFEIEKANIPGATEVTPTTGTIPELDISDAHLVIDMLALMAGSPGGGADSGKAPIDEATIATLLDSLDGKLSLIVYIVSDGDDFRIPVELSFTEGKIDYQKVEASLQGKITARAAGKKDSPSGFITRMASEPKFWMEGSDLVFGVHITDIGMPVLAGPGGGVPSTTSTPSTFPLDYEILRWNLPSDEVKPARDLHQLRIERLRHLATEEPTSEAGKAVQQQESKDRLESIELEGIEADLSLKNKKPIPIMIKTATVAGTVELDADALIGFRVPGFKGSGIGAKVRPKSRSRLPGGTGLRAVSIEAVKVKKTDLRIQGATQVTTGSIEISKLHDASVDMDAVYPPHVLGLAATIATAVAHQIHWDLAAKP